MEMCRILSEELEAANQVKNSAMEAENHVQHGARSKSQKPLLYLAMLLICGLFFSSCSYTYLKNGYGTKFETSLNSFGNYDIIGKTFYVESGNTRISNNDVEFREYANYVAESLKLSGAIETRDRTTADMVVLIDYGIFDESYTVTVPIPIWGQTGVSSVRTTSQTTGSSHGSVTGSATRIGNTASGYASGSSTGSSTTTTTTNVTPSYGITGYTSVNRNVALYRRVLNIYAYDNRRTSSPTMLWKVNMISEGNSRELRTVLPYMAYVSWGRIGKSSGGNENFTVFENDEFFRWWKEGILSSGNVTTFPQYASTNSNNNFRIASVQKLSNETIVVLQKRGCYKSYTISPITYIEASGQRYNISRIDGYVLGKKIKRECGTRYFILRFPQIPRNASNINVSIGARKWNGLKIK